jgi:hypothetical protein
MMSAVLIPAVLTLAGCSATHLSAVSGPWAVEIEDAQRLATTDFERRVLQDGDITRDEYLEASQRYVDCMRSAGYNTRATDPLGSGLFQYETSVAIGEPDLDDEVSDECHQGTLGVIEPLYNNLFTNPMREDFDALVLACLQRNGFAPTEMTASEFKQRFVSGSEKPPWNNGDDRAQLCYQNPARG